MTTCFVLSHFQPIFHFYNPIKYKKSGYFLMLSGGMEVEQLKIGSFGND